MSTQHVINELDPNLVGLFRLIVYEPPNAVVIELEPALIRYARRTSERCLVHVVYILLHEVSSPSPLFGTSARSAAPYRMTSNVSSLFPHLVSLVAFDHLRHFARIPETGGHVLARADDPAEASFHPQASWRVTRAANNPTFGLGYPRKSGRHRLMQCRAIKSAQPGVFLLSTKSAENQTQVIEGGAAKCKSRRPRNSLNPAH